MKKITTLALAVSLATISLSAAADDSYGVYPLVGVSHASPNHANNVVIPIWQQQTQAFEYSVVMSQPLNGQMYLLNEQGAVLDHVTTSSCSYDSRLKEDVCQLTGSVASLPKGFYSIAATSNSNNDGNVFIISSSADYHQPIKLAKQAFISPAAVLSNADSQYKTIEMNLLIEEGENLELRIGRRTSNDALIGINVFSPDGELLVNSSHGAHATAILGQRPAGVYRIQIMAGLVQSFNYEQSAEAKGFVVNYSAGTLNPIAKRDGYDVHMDYVNGTASQKYILKAVIDDVVGSGAPTTGLTVGDIITADYEFSLDAGFHGEHQDANTFVVSGGQEAGKITITSPQALQGLSTDHFDLSIRDYGDDVVDSTYLYSSNFDRLENIGSATDLLFMSINMNNFALMGKRGNEGKDAVQVFRTDTMNSNIPMYVRTINCADNSTTCTQVNESHITARLLSISAAPTSDNQISYSPYGICKEAAEWVGGAIYATKSVGNGGQLDLSFNHFTAREFCTLPNIGRSIKSVELIGSDTTKFQASPFAMYGSHYEGYGCKLLLNNDQPLNPNQTLSPMSIAQYQVIDVPVTTTANSSVFTPEYANQANLSCHFDVGTPYHFEQILVEYN